MQQGGQVGMQGKPMQVGGPMQQPNGQAGGKPNTMQGAGMANMIPQRSAPLVGGLMTLQQPPNQLPDAILATEEPADLESKPIVEAGLLANQLSTQGLKQASEVRGLGLVSAVGKEQEDVCVQ